MTMRKTPKAIFLFAITVTMIIAFTVNIIYQQQPERQQHDGIKISEITNHEKENKPVLLPSKRVSRFLEQSAHQHRRSLKPADHCNKDYEVCNHGYGVNSTCCGNKCFDLTIDKDHCGACHNKCKYTYNCCKGECVDLAYDKRHCGMCNNKCLTGQYCIYGMCDYA